MKVTSDSQVDEQMSFVIDKSNAGEGELLLVVNGPAKVDSDTQECDQGTKVGTSQLAYYRVLHNSHTINYFHAMHFAFLTAGAVQVLQGG